MSSHRDYAAFVSSNVLNIESNVVIVCPATDAAGKKTDIVHILARAGGGGLTKDCIFLCEQVKAVDQSRLIEKKGNLQAETMRQIDKGLRVTLSLN